MIVWGGESSVNLNDFNNGGLYDPAANSWTAMTTNGAPAGRTFQVAVWTGSQMIICDGFGEFNFNSIYNDTWLYTPSQTLYLYQKQ